MCGYYHPLGFNNLKVFLSYEMSTEGCHCKFEQQVSIEKTDGDRKRKKSQITYYTMA